jgi:hypothetical protein
MTWEPSKYLQRVAELERDDPDIRDLGYRVREAVERGRGEDAANDAFNAAVDRKLSADGGWCRGVFLLSGG